MGLYSNMGSANETGGGVHWQEGDYLVEVLKHVEGVSGTGGGNYVAIEARVVHVLRSVEERTWPHNAEPKLPASNTVGQQPSQVVFLKHFSAMGNLKSFITGASGMSAEDIVKMHCSMKGIDVARAEDDVVIGAAFEAIAERAFGGEGDLFAGKIVHLRAVVVPKKNKDPFTKCVWSTPTEEQLAVLKTASA